MGTAPVRLEESGAPGLRLRAQMLPTNWKTQGNVLLQRRAARGAPAGTWILGPRPPAPGGDPSLLS